MIVYKSGYYYSDFINDPQYFSGFSTKQLGNGKERSDIQAFLDRELIAGKLVIPQQRHTEAILVIPSPTSAESAKFADAVVTNQKNVSLCVLTADCVPIVYIDKEAGVIGASHQGWKGVMQRLPEKVIKKMTDLGANPQKILVAIGPSVGGCCYKIYGKRKMDFEDEFPDYFSRCLNCSGEEFFMNLAQLSYYQLIEAGIDKTLIDYFPFCTKCNEKQFFSFQREGKIEGEMFHVIAMK